MRLQATLLTALLAVLILGASSRAQCGGNGANGDLSSDPMTLGSTIAGRVSGGAGQPYLYYLAGNRTPNLIPGVGWACLSLADPTLLLLAQGTLNGNGSATLPFTIPNSPALLPFVAYVQAGVGDPTGPGGIAITPALRVDFENPDSYVTLPALPSPRGLASGTRMGDGRVLVAGGGGGTILGPVQSSTTDLYDPTTRSWSAGPNMSIARVLHTSTRLLDGRVLLTGGMADSLGNVTATCEIFDPWAGAFSPAASMGGIRVGHTATLLNDGRVLVTGGTTTMAAASATDYTAILNGSVDTAEVYDPATDTWTPVATPMASPRFLATAVRLNDGRVLVVSGLSAGIASSVFGVVFTIPVWTQTSDIFDPATGTWSSAPPLLGTDARSASSSILLSDGRVWVAGGAVNVNNGPASTTSTLLFDGTAWTQGPVLPTDVALAGLVTLTNGKVLTVGGITGTQAAPGAAADVLVFDGTSLTPVTGLPAPRGGLNAVRLKDGSVLLAGGNDTTAAQADSWLYYPNP